MGVYSNSGSLQVNPSIFPDGATALHSSSGNVANASAVATLAAVAGKTNYLTGILITGSGATAASVQSVTITGLLGGTLTLTYTVPAGATTTTQPLAITFPFPLPASAVNTAIVLTAPAFGAGNTNASVSAFGFVL